MTKDRALKQAVKRWGKRALIRMDQDSSSPFRREAASNTLELTRKRMAEIDATIKQRLAELDWYQELTTERKQLAKTSGQMQSDAMYHRFSVGRDSGVFFEVLGSGDSWEEAFAQADKRTEAA